MWWTRTFDASPGEQTGQLVDATSRTWETKQSNQLDFTSEYEDGDSELGGGLEPNLVNHPSYQERGNIKRRSKRTLLKDTREPEKASPMEVRSRFEPRVEPRMEPRVERDVVERVVPTKLSLPSILPNVLPTKPIEEPTQELVEVIEAAPVDIKPLVAVENGLERPNKRDIKTKVVEPPELIVVEMTEEEQDVYSLIGISPLVLVDREVKDPRNVIVTVALPGQAPKMANAITSNIDIESEHHFEDNFVMTEVVEYKTNDSEVIETEVIETETPEIEAFETEVVPTEQPTNFTPSNGASNGVILRVNRVQPVVSTDLDTNLELDLAAKAEVIETSREFVPIQSPEASRRKRSSASQA